MGGSVIVVTQEQLNSHHDDLQTSSVNTKDIISKNINGHEADLDKRSPYEMLRPKNENFLLNHLREWEQRVGFKTPLIWSSLIAIIGFHILTVGVTLHYLLRWEWPTWQAFAFGIFMGGVAGFGVTAGAHRYWSHRCYKARLPLQIILLICYSVAGQNNLFNWVRDHRVHHKFSESSADPHDANRGFFFAHVGWLMMKKHPEVIRRGNQIDMSDITEDPLLQFYNKYFNVFKLLFSFIIPTLVPILWWNETLGHAMHAQMLTRYMLSLNFTWSVNSFAHLWGNKPYDRYIMPVENKGVSFFAMGEGFHNYHHTFPWDYKAAELGNYNLNVTTFWLDFFRRIGWAYDMKYASPELVRAVADRRGNSTEIKERKKRY